MQTKSVSTELCSFLYYTYLPVDRIQARKQSITLFRDFCVKKLNKPVDEAWRDEQFAASDGNFISVAYLQQQCVDGLYVGPGMVSLLDKVCLACVCFQKLHLSLVSQPECVDLCKGPEQVALDHFKSLRQAVVLEHCTSLAKQHQLQQIGSLQTFSLSQQALVSREKVLDLPWLPNLGVGLRSHRSLRISL